MNEYLVIYERAEDGGWGAYLPDLPGVISLGETREETEAGIKEAVAAYVDYLSEGEGDLPQPAHESGFVRA